MKTIHFFFFFFFNALRDDVHTHIATLISTMRERGIWVFFCTVISNKMKKKHSVLFDQFERHIYTIVSILLFIKIEYFKSLI